MLPSRLFRNIGLPPPLRSLLKPYTSLPASLKAQLRLGVIPSSRFSPASRIASFSTSPSRTHDSSPSPETAKEQPTPTTSTAPESQASSSSAPAPTATSQPLPEQIEPKLQITFTCTVEGCGERSTHQFTKRAYTRGIVLVQCPGCQNRHLIADHLGWFKESTEEGKLKTIEDLLRAKGEKVRRGRVDTGGVVEYSD